jgi:hypothetical protein
MGLPSVIIKGGLKHQREDAYAVYKWCLPRLGITDYDHLVTIYLRKIYQGDHHGYCQDLGKKHYKIVVAVNQPLRQWVMTLVHELIHFKQYKEGCWTGDGEEEAWSLQEQLTDELWAEDIL